MRVYVAAASAPEERDRAKLVIAKLATHGVECTSTWIESIERHGGVANPRDGHAVRLAAATENVRAIGTSDVVLFLVPRDAPGCGGYFEVGYAHGHGAQLMFAGDTKQSVFCSLGIEFEHDADAVVHVVAIARRFAS